MILDDAIALIRRCHQGGRLAHAYLVGGAPRGIGRAFAERVCQLLLCQDAGAPCGICTHCRLAAEHKAADALWVEPEKKSRVIPIDTVREVIIPWASRTSFEGGWKILVISFADRFNENSANAFLKTLEEPPPRTLFLLLTNSPEMVLSTIVSRCHRIELGMGREPPAEPWRGMVGEILAKHRPLTEVGVFATASRLEAVFNAMEAEAKQAVKAEEADSDLDEDRETIDARITAKLRELRMTALVAVQEWYRDLLLVASGAPERPLHFEEHRAELERRAKGVAPRRALAYVGFAEDISRQLNDRHMQAGPVLAYWLGRMG
jgi:DNA polymerase-3 subunit delta'